MIFLPAIIFWAASMAISIVGVSGLYPESVNSIMQWVWGGTLLLAVVSFLIAIIIEE